MNVCTLTEAGKRSVSEQMSRLVRRRAVALWSLGARRRARGFENSRSSVGCGSQWSARAKISFLISGGSWKNGQAGCGLTGEFKGGLAIGKSVEEGS